MALYLGLSGVMWPAPELESWFIPKECPGESQSLFQPLLLLHTAFTHCQLHGILSPPCWWKCRILFCSDSALDRGGVSRYFLNTPTPSTGDVGCPSTTALFFTAQHLPWTRKYLQTKPFPNSPHERRSYWVIFSVKSMYFISRAQELTCSLAMQYNSQRLIWI